jgi:protein FAM98B
MSENQWNQMHKINKILYEDYKTRRELLLKRLDVTIQSFKWADRLKVMIESEIGRNLFLILG